MPPSVPSSSRRSSADRRPSRRARAFAGAMRGTEIGLPARGRPRGERSCAMLRFSGAGVTDVGKVRDHNEDSAFMAPYVALVADGVGGAAAGEVASATTAYVVSAHALARFGSDPAQLLRDAVVDRPAEPRARGAERPDASRNGHHAHRAAHRRHPDRPGAHRRLARLSLRGGSADPDLVRSHLRPETGRRGPARSRCRASPPLAQRRGALTQRGSGPQMSSPRRASTSWSSSLGWVTAICSAATA